ncbi:long-chain-fatty-acid--CoA ligase [Salinirubellus salinus]|uniref:Long-chain-fatty-acid--CoA ligase n=1 Tax=Salinirubellus salinus TaxID=1364945 RepID=A0A9E7U8X2_9EURY|nr:long-chain-fatty-acid--CoA ligase [Salinirubellus salinus]UWM55291.1 long-chain-fatty-acid--CoA ligase [Salinirubellus salinus]
MRKPLLVTEFLDRARDNYPEAEAVVATTGERYSYAELGARSDAFSEVLQDHGIEKGDRVAVLDPNTHYHLEAAYGIFQAGGVHTPLNYRLTPKDYTYILNDAGVDAIYADWDYADKIEEIRDEVPTETFITNDTEKVDGDWQSFDDLVEAADGDYDRPEMSEDEICTINYTSGTTGDPKGVCRTHRTETIHAYLISSHQDISDDDVYLWTLPMFHANGWGHIFAITGNAAKHVCTRGIDAGWIFETVRDEDVSYMCAAPTVLNMLLEYHGANEDVVTEGAADVRVATAGSAPPEATIRTIEDEFGWYMIHVYGLTETGPLITTSNARRLFDDDDAARFDVKKRQGMAYLGTEIRVVDEDGEQVPRDDKHIGEVVVRGNQVMEKYWNKPEETHEAFNDRIEGWFHTGDLATMNENGMISIQDRKKDLIISGGENISSIEVEDALYDHPAVGAAAVIPAPSDKYGETVKAFVVPANGDPENPGVTEEELKQFTREELASYKRVRRVEFVKELPTTATGKVQKYELRKREWDEEERMIGQG